MSVVWMELLAWEFLQLPVARTGSASQEGFMQDLFCCCCFPPPPQLVTAGGRILLKLDLCSEQFCLPWGFQGDGKFPVRGNVSQ